MASSEETKQFAELSEDDMSTMLEKAVPDNNRKATDAWVTMFKAYCRERKMAFDMSTCSAEELNKFFGNFTPVFEQRRARCTRSQATSLHVRLDMDHFRSLNDHSIYSRLPFLPNHIAFSTQPSIVENARQSHTWQWDSGHVRSRSEECM